MTPILAQFEFESIKIDSINTLSALEQLLEYAQIHQVFAIEVRV